MKTSPSVLLDNLPNLHTTKLGIKRIRQNLSLPEDCDVVEWCRGVIADPATAILRRGKNWYAMTADCTITVNASSYSIITAHKKENEETPV